MSSSKALAFALAITSVYAGPIANPSRIVPRVDPPVPSPFPLGDACEHEWQYLNFNKDDETDKAHLQKMHDIICGGEMRAISSYASLSAEKALAPYLRYFAASDEEDDTQTHVKDVMDLIAGTSSTDGKVGAIVGTFVVDNLDFAVNNPDESNCQDEGQLAYTLEDNLDSREKIHFCEEAWTGRLDSIADVDCDSLDPFPSDKIDAFSRIMLHEMLHYSTVGPPSSLDDKIIDATNEDKWPAYDIDRAHGLIDENQDNQPAKAEINADNYAYMAMDTYASYTCATDRSETKWAGFFTQNPPDYVHEPEDPDDPSDPDDLQTKA